MIDVDDIQIGNEVTTGPEPIIGKVVRIESGRVLIEEIDGERRWFSRGDVSKSQTQWEHDKRENELSSRFKSGDRVTKDGLIGTVVSYVNDGWWNIREDRDVAAGIPSEHGGRTWNGTYITRLVEIIK